MGKRVLHCIVQGELSKASDFSLHTDMQTEVIKQNSRLTGLCLQGSCLPVEISFLNSDLHNPAEHNTTINHSLGSRLVCSLARAENLRDRSCLLTVAALCFHNSSGRSQFQKQQPPPPIESVAFARCKTQLLRTRQQEFQPQNRWKARTSIPPSTQGCSRAVRHPGAVPATGCQHTVVANPAARPELEEVTTFSVHLVNRLFPYENAYLFQGLRRFPRR